MIKTKTKAPRTLTIEEAREIAERAAPGRQDADTWEAWILEQAGPEGWFSCGKFGGNYLKMITINEFRFTGYGETPNDATIQLVAAIAIARGL